MTRQGLAVGSSALAGFVDAHGYLALGGVFVAFMSGNSTIAGTSLITGSASRWIACALVLTFVAGVVTGTSVGQRFGARRVPVVMLLVAGLILAAAALHRFGQTEPCCLVLAVAMGAENTVFERPGKEGTGLTYMTGALVHIGQGMAEALAGGSWGVVLPSLLLWSSMVGGAMLGAATYGWVGLDGLWAAAAAMLALAVVALRDRRPTSAA